MKKRAAPVALTGILAALALALSFLESLLPPLPMTPPGYKLGLSNIVSMYAAGSLGLPCALFLTVLKGGFAFFNRGAMASAMSLSGGVLSTVTVWFLLRHTRTPWMLLGACGALAHNAGQLLCAWVLTSASVLFYIPMLLLFSVLTGALTGTVLKIALPAIEKIPFSQKK